MARLTYAEQLKHPNWQRVRLQKLQAADWKCEACDQADATLHVHHKLYVKGRLVWEYESHELEVLCEGCHAEKHSVRALLDRVLSMSDPYRDPASIALGLVTGYLVASYDLDAEIEQEVRAKASVMVDMGIVAYQIGLSNGHEVAKALEQLRPLAPDATDRDPVFADLLYRWSKPRDAGAA